MKCTTGKQEEGRDEETVFCISDLEKQQFYFQMHMLYRQYSSILQQS
jgi:hypothetical protein